MANKICDFCLEEGRGLFRQPESLKDGHYICKKCRKILEEYDLTVKFDLLQLLVTAEPYMRELMIEDYLDHHKPADVIAKYFPIQKMPLHSGEHCVNMREASITVSRLQIPQRPAVRTVEQVGRDDIVNLSDAKNDSKAVEAEGILCETDAALYFLSKNFINVHRLTSIVTTHPDTEALHVLEQGREYTYDLPNADLFLLRSMLYHKAMAVSEHGSRSLIYLASENTMTLTRGRYSVPKNIKSGVYWVNPVEDADLAIQDANGKVRYVKPGRIRLDEGSTIEVNGDYQLRYNKREDPPEE